MQGLSLSKEIAGMVSALGIVPTLAIVAICGFFLFREIKKALGSLADTVAKQTLSLEKQLAAFKAESTLQDEKILAMIEEHDKEIRSIESTFLTREQHYRDFENWRTEIQELRGEVRSLPVTILNMIKGQSK